jgi:hypothetical protein
VETVQRKTYSSGVTITSRCELCRAFGSEWKHVFILVPSAQTRMALSCIVDLFVHAFAHVQKSFLRNGTELSQAQPQALV